MSTLSSAASGDTLRVAVLMMISEGTAALCPFFGKCDGVLVIDHTQNPKIFPERGADGGVSRRSDREIRCGSTRVRLLLRGWKTAAVGRRDRRAFAHVHPLGRGTCRRCLGPSRGLKPFFPDRREHVRQREGAPPSGQLRRNDTPACGAGHTRGSAEPSSRIVKLPNPARSTISKCRRSRNLTNWRASSARNERLTTASDNPT